MVVPSWQGLYFGGHAGGVWGNTDVHDHFDYVGDPEFNGNLGSTGFIGGAQAGYNIQRGHFVFGPEADIGYLGISASKSASNLGPQSCTANYAYNSPSVTYYDPRMCQADAKYSVSGGLYGDLTARLGYAVDRTLFYVKGGVAILDADFKTNYSGDNCTTTGGCWNESGKLLTTTPVRSTFAFDHGDTLVGSTAGAGVEYALSPSWSFKAEYQHFDFGKMSSSNHGCYGIPVSAGSTYKYGDSRDGTCPAANSTTNNHYTSTIDGKTDVSIANGGAAGTHWLCLCRTPRIFTYCYPLMAMAAWATASGITGLTLPGINDEPA